MADIKKDIFEGDPAAVFKARLLLVVLTGALFFSFGGAVVDFTLMPDRYYVFLPLRALGLAAGLFLTYRTYNKRVPFKLLQIAGFAVFLLICLISVIISFQKIEFYRLYCVASYGLMVFSSVVIPWNFFTAAGFLALIWAMHMAPFWLFGFNSPAVTAGGINIFLIISSGMVLALVMLGGYLRKQEVMQGQYMENLASRDGLTGLLNTRKFNTVLGRAIKETGKTGGRIDLLLLDLDNLKEINDTYGHPEGDRVLEFVGQVISTRTRSRDCAFRIGGDEFAVILLNAGSDMAEVVAERILGGMSSYDGRLVPSVSVGIASFPEHARDRHGLYWAADKALYSAKQEKGCVCKFDRSMAREGEKNVRCRMP